MDWFFDLVNDLLSWLVSLIPQFWFIWPKEAWIITWYKLDIIILFIGLIIISIATFFISKKFIKKDNSEENSHQALKSVFIFLILYFTFSLFWLLSFFLFCKENICELWKWFYLYIPAVNEIEIIWIAEETLRVNWINIVTKDWKNITLSFVLFYKVWDPKSAILEYENAHQILQEYSKWITAMNITEATLNNILEGRKSIEWKIKIWIQGKFLKSQGGEASSINIINFQITEIAESKPIKIFWDRVILPLEIK